MFDDHNLSSPYLTDALVVLNISKFRDVDCTQINLIIISWDTLRRITVVQVDPPFWDVIWSWPWGNCWWQFGVSAHDRPDAKRSHCMGLHSGIFDVNVGLTNRSFGRAWVSVCIQGTEWPTMTSNSTWRRKTGRYLLWHSSTVWVASTSTNSQRRWWTPSPNCKKINWPRPQPRSGDIIFSNPGTIRCRCRAYLDCLLRFLWFQLAVPVPASLVSPSWQSLVPVES